MQGTSYGRKNLICAICSMKSQGREYGVHVYLTLWKSTVLWSCPSFHRHCQESSPWAIHSSRRAFSFMLKSSCYICLPKNWVNDIMLKGEQALFIKGPIMWQGNAVKVTRSSLGWLRTFNTVPHVRVTPQPHSLLLHNCNFTPVMDHIVNLI